MIPRLTNIGDMKKPKKKRKDKKFIGYTRLCEPHTNTPVEIYTRGGRACPPPAGMPDKMVIQGKHYKIIYHTLVYSKDKSRLLGVVNYGHRMIVIDASRPVHEMKDTLFHEVCHVCLFAGQHSFESLRKLSYQQIEDLCDTFGESICDLALNNNL